MEDMAITINGRRLIPIYAVFLTLIEMWRECPDTVRSGETAKQQSRNLKDLSSLYFSDCLIGRSIITDIKSTESELNSCFSQLLKCKKSLRRLEGNMRVFTSSSEW